ncbi:MAG: hypothetical protein K0R49_283 [Burkholderiales bacterium]|jgi:hypothetical protein|nr:hypothetical protein [Burkholderiales bacterium]
MKKLKFILSTLTILSGLSAMSFADTCPRPDTLTWDSKTGKWTAGNWPEEDNPQISMNKTSRIKKRFLGALANNDKPDNSELQCMYLITSKVPNPIKQDVILLSPPEEEYKSITFSDNWKLTSEVKSEDIYSQLSAKWTVTATVKAELERILSSRTHICLASHKDEINTKDCQFSKKAPLKDNN